MTSVLDLHTLTPEARRLDDLETFVFHWHRLCGLNAIDIHKRLAAIGFDYTREEIDNMIKETTNG